MVLSCNSVYSDLADFFFLSVIVVVLINEIAFQNPNDPRDLDKHTSMLVSSKLFHNIPIFSCFFVESLSRVLGAVTISLEASSKAEVV